MKKKLLLILTFFIISACGFKIANYSKINNFKISKIETTGDNKINYKLKNKIQQMSNANSDKNIKLIIITQNNKSIKEKNIKNEITKYRLEFIAKINFKILEINEQNSFDISVIGDYLVSDKYSQTLKNERDLIDNLTDQLSSLIARKLAQSLNDF
tara:strand:+ start:308 stop:775 length:468 start_codon:yes stop_codon:yes gene_type:complete